MNMSSTIVALAAAGMMLPAGAIARPLHHHRHYAARAYGFAHRAYAPHRYAYRYAPRPYDYAPPYAYGDAPGSRAYDGGPYGDAQIIEDATVRAQHEPGVTSELAPDAKQTATGGPVGGVPGFSGF